MPYGDPDPQDPNMLVGVSVPADPEAVREMAYAFAEEFAALGFDERRLLALFKQPFYAGPHRAYRALGETAIRSIIAESIGVWGRMRTVVKVPEPPAGLQHIASDLVQIGSGCGIGSPEPTERAAPRQKDKEAD